MAETLDQQAPADRGAPECPNCGGPLGSPGIVGRDRLISRPGSFAGAPAWVCRRAPTLPRLSGPELEPHYPPSYEPYREHGPGITRGAIPRIRALHMAIRLRRPPLRDLVAGPAGRLLDVGCGRGDLAAAFVRRGWDVAGVDPSD